MIPNDYWHRRGYILEEYCFTDFPQGSLVLDVGCGEGEQMEEAARKGIRIVGIDRVSSSMEKCREKGLTFIFARGEGLPFKRETFDGVICKVSLPYMDEARTLSEITTVMKPGSEMELCVHALGYYAHYLLFCPAFKTRVYSAFTILNTWIYRLTGKLWRTTIYQSDRRLRRYFDRFGLDLVRFTSSRRFAGIPVYLYYRLVKREKPGAGSHGSEDGPAACR